MATEWLDVQEEDVLTRMAMVEGYSLTVVGEGGQWLWFIDRNGGHFAEGMAHDLDAAMAAAEDKARQLAEGHAGDVKPGST
jgi:hypothetical protein